MFSYPTLNRFVKGEKTGQASLAWEEGAPSGVFGMPAGSSPKRFLLMPFLMVVGFLVLLSRLFWTQVVDGAEFRALAEDNRVNQRVVLAPRGKILDRYGDVLADSRAGFALTARPSWIPKEDRQKIADMLAGILKMPTEEVLKKLDFQDSSGFSVIAKNLSEETQVLLSTKLTEVPGLSLEVFPERFYTYPVTLSHVLGFTGAISDNELSELLNKGYHRQDVVGKKGIEAVYESYLKGVNGADRLEVDARGKIVQELGISEPIVGNSLTLTIDAGLQNLLYESFAKKGDKGAAVALDPKTGEVLALVSVPGFDANMFSGKLTNEDFQKLLSDKKQPLFNRVVAGTYPPGSTVKPMMSAAALQEGLITDSTVIYDGGFLSVPNQYNPEIEYRYHGWKRTGLGPLNVYGAVARSSDIFFYVVGGGHPSSQVKPLGVERIARYFRAFGLGVLTGIDLFGEVAGTVPDPAWKEKYFANDPVMRKWVLGNTYHLSIGQGDLLVTPLQAAFWTAIIANDGVGLRPHLLKTVTDNSGRDIKSEERAEVVRVPISPETMGIVKETMKEAVLIGGAKQMQNLPITSGGKTGTSQFDGADLSRTHSWFTAFAPFENPQIAIAVILEAGGEGYSGALPITYEAIDWWAKNRLCPTQPSLCKDR